MIVDVKKIQMPKNQISTSKVQLTIPTVLVEKAESLEPVLFKKPVDQCREILTTALNSLNDDGSNFHEILASIRRCSGHKN